MNNCNNQGVFFFFFTKVLLVFADKKYSNTKGALWEKNKHKIPNTRIIKRAKGKLKGRGGGGRYPSDTRRCTTNIFTGNISGGKSQ